MFSLRQINNQYADFAGSRSDFVVVGHPEFNLGKYGSDAGYGPEWDNRRAPHHPARSLAADRMRRSGSVNHIKRLTDLSPKASLKARAMSRSSSSSATKNRDDPSTLNVADGGSFSDVDAFIADLTRSEKLPAVGMQVVASGYSNHIRSQPKCKHYSMLQEDLAELRTRAKSTPSKVRAELLEDDTWRYFASHLEQARRREAAHRRQCNKAKSNVTAVIRAPSGAIVDPMKSAGLGV